jgi:alkyldihydroxyacetonephosphate synthase
MWPLWGTGHSTPDSSRFRDGQKSSLIYPEKKSHENDGEESINVWGFQDTRFRMDSEGVVEVTGNRYPLSGQQLPSLIPWFSKLMDVEISAAEKYQSSYPPIIPEPNINHDFLAGVRGVFEEDQIIVDPKHRLRHGHGHSQSEMYAIKHGHLERVPDAVIYPKNEEQVSSLVQAASKHNVCLIPFGGGTNVSEALECPHNEKRMIVSVDMRRMNRIIWIDPINRMACIEAGAVGRHIMEDLAVYGLTMGHEPDSVEFSTLGGWIATNASGMKKNKYGNIEDLILDISVVAVNGTLKRAEFLPRESTGSDVRNLMFGSEGTLGIITSAVVKLSLLPEVQHYGSVLFSSFEDGVAFMYALTQAGGQPASVRLVDNTQFQLSMALKPAPSRLGALISRIQKAYVTTFKGFDPDKMVACTLVFEGSADDVKHQEDLLYRIAAQHNGMQAGAENGERGYLLTYNIAYIRDFGNEHYILAESFETSVPWSRVLELCDRVKQRVNEEHTIRKLPGNPFVSCRVTQVYDTGAAVYFYFAYFCKGVENPSEAYAEIEKAARDEILLCGGALSHHHGVGKLRKEFLPRIMTCETLDWLRKIKGAVDPDNIFGSSNLVSE